MTRIATGCALPVGTFYCAPNTVIVNESSIISISTQFGSRIRYESDVPIRYAALLPDNVIALHAEKLLLFNAKTYNVSQFEDDTFKSFSSQIISMKACGVYLVFGTACSKLLIYRMTDGELKFSSSIKIEFDIRTESLVELQCFTVNDSLGVSYIMSNSMSCLTLTSHILASNGSSVSEHLQIPAVKFITHWQCFAFDDKISHVLVEGDTVVLAVLYMGALNWKSSVFKVRSKNMISNFKTCITGPSYNLNDMNCPSFLLFGNGNDAIIGMLYADTIKFWHVFSELEDVDNAICCQDTGLFFCASRSKAAFLDFDIKNLKMTVAQYVDAFFPFKSLSPPTAEKSDSIYCLSVSNDFIFKLGNGIYMKNRLCSDPMFKGTNGIWTFKKHYLDPFHAFVCISSNASSLILSLEDTTATDATGLIGIKANETTISLFNVINTSCIVQVTPCRIVVIDLGKLDTAAADPIKQEIFSASESWKFASHHGLHMVCIAEDSTSLSLFQIRNRPRDIDLILPAGNFDMLQLLEKSEICHLFMTTDAQSVHVMVGTVSGQVIILKFGLDFVFQSHVVLQFSSPLNSASLLPNPKAIMIVLGFRNGQAAVVNVNSGQVDIHELSPSPLSTCQFTFDSVIIFNEQTAKIMTCENDRLYLVSCFDWKISNATELQLHPQEPWIVGIEDDCLVTYALNRSHIASVVRKVIFNTAKIHSFLHLESDNWLVAHQVSDTSNLLSLFSPTGASICEFDEGVDEPTQIVKHREREDVFLLLLRARNRTNSKIQVISLAKDRFSIIGEFVCNEDIKKICLDKNYIVYPYNDELRALELCPFTLAFQRRAVFHFRNQILDFDAARGSIIVSTRSDGIDVLSFKVNETSFSLVNERGDKYSRSCLSCIWLEPGRLMLAADKNKRVSLCEIHPDSKFITEVKFWTFSEIITYLFQRGNEIYAQTISGGIIKIDME